METIAIWFDGFLTSSLFLRFGRIKWIVSIAILYLLLQRQLISIGRNRFGAGLSDRLLLNDRIIGIWTTSLRCLQWRWNKWWTSTTKWIIHSWRLRNERTNYIVSLIEMVGSESFLSTERHRWGRNFCLMPPSNETEQHFVLDGELPPLQIMMVPIRALLTNCCSNGLIASCCNDCCCGRCENENWLLPRAIGGRANWNPWLPFGWMVNGLGDIWKKSCWREAGVCDCCFRRRKKNRIYVQHFSSTHFLAVRTMISIMVIIYFVS